VQDVQLQTPSEIGATYPRPNCGRRISTTLGVASNQDSTAPVLQAFALSPSSIDTTGAPATVQASFTVADDLSGIVFVAVFLQSPSLISLGRVSGAHPSLTH